VHDRGRVLADTAVMIAGGGRGLSDLATLRDQGELFGPVASDPTLRRALAEIDPLALDRIAHLPSTAHRRGPDLRVPGLRAHRRAGRVSARTPGCDRHKRVRRP
jgi:hypothetical protein